MLIICINLW